MERRLYLLRPVACLVSVLVAWAPARGAHAAPLLPEDFTVEGRLFDSLGAPINSNVDFKLELVDDAGTCVLYRESRTGIDLSSTDTTAQGVFSLRLGAGTKEYGTLAFTQMFSPGAQTGEGGCTATPLSATAHRKVRVSIRLSGGGAFETLSPDTSITSTPLAKVAENALTLEGHPSADFIQVNGTSALSQTNTEYAFSMTNWPKLKALLDGSSSQYAPATPAAAVNMNGQRVTNLADPTAAQDAATKHYVDTTVAGQPVDVTAVGPMTGGGSTLLWDQTANKWVAGTISSAPTGAAGGDLNGTYPNPTVKNDAIASAKINSSGIAVNRLLITDATTGATVGYGACSTVNQVYAWTASGWACTTVASLAPVTSVAGKTGAVTLNAADVGGLGTASLKDYGTGANQVVILDSAARLPAVDGSQLTQVNAVQLQSRAIASLAPSAGQVLGWNAAATQWQPTSLSATGVTQVSSGIGLVSGSIVSTGTINVDVGTAPNKVVQENGNAQIAQANGSAGVPSFAFAPSPNTGVFSPGANQLALSVNGTAALSLLASGSVVVNSTAPVTNALTGALQVRGGLGVDGGINSSGLIVAKTLGSTASNAQSYAGTASQPTPVDGTSGPSLNIQNSAVANGAFAMINFGTLNANNQNQNAYVGAVSAGTGYSPSIVIGQQSAMSAYAERLRIDPNGNVGLGTITPLAALDITSLGLSSAIVVPRDTTGNRPAGANGMLRYNTSTNAFEGYAAGTWSTFAAGSAAGTVTNIASGSGLLGGPITTVGTLSVDAGTAANKIVQENANAQIAQSKGSLTLPAYTFAGMTNTGVYSPGTGSLTLVSSGSAALSVLPNGSVSIGSLAAATQGDGMLNVQGGLYVDYLSQNNANLVNGLRFGGNGSTIGIASSQQSPINRYGLDFYTGNNNRLAISMTGQVGIGTTAPQAILDLVATGTTSALILPRDVTTNRPTGVNGMLRYNTTTAQFEGYVGGSWAPLVSGSAVTSLNTGTGLLGGPISGGGTLSADVGTAANKLVQENANAQIAQANGVVSAPAFSFVSSPLTGVYSPGADQLALSTNGAQRLVVDSTGRVGINSSAPGAQLDVGGDVRTSGAFALPYVSVKSVNNNSLNWLDVQSTGTGAIGTALSISPPTGQTWSSLTLFNNTTKDINNYGYVSVQGSDMGVGTNGNINVNLRTNGAVRMAISPNGAIGIGTTAATSGNGLNVVLPTTFNNSVIQKVDTTQNSSPLDFSAANIVQAGTGVTCGASSPTLNNLQSGGSYTVIITDTGSAACGFSGSGLTYKYLPPNDVRLGGSTSAIYNILVVGTIAYVTWVSGF